MKFKDSSGCRSLLDYMDHAQVSGGIVSDGPLCIPTLNVDSSFANNPHSFRLMTSHKELLATIEDLRRHGVCKMTIKDVQNHYSILYGDRICPTTIAPRLNELAREGRIGKDEQRTDNGEVVYYAYSEVRV